MNDINLDQFIDETNKLDFEAYQAHAIAALKQGKPLIGKEGIATRS